jgi:hypothetical protein
MEPFATLRARAAAESPHQTSQTKDAAAAAFAEQVLPLYLRGGWKVTDKNLLSPSHFSITKSKAHCRPELDLDPPVNGPIGGVSVYDHITSFRLIGARGASHPKNTVLVTQPYTNRNIISVNPEFVVLSLWDKEHDWYYPDSARGFLVAHRMHLPEAAAQAA